MAVIYFDNNVFAHVNEAGEEAAFATWLSTSGHVAFLSFNHLWEALTIPDDQARKTRIRLLRDIPSRYVKYPPYLEAMELRDEIRHFRPGWLRTFPDTSKVDINLNFHKKLWHIAEHEDEVATTATRLLADLTNARRASALDTQKMLRKLRQDGAAGETTLTLGPHVIEFGTAASSNDPVAWWRRHALSNWYGALLGGDNGLSDWADYLGGYLDRRAIEIGDFAAFWLEDARPEAMPRSFVHFAVVLGQLDHKVERGNLLDADHASASLDADVFVTEDKSLDAVLRAVKRLEARLPEPCLAARAEGSAVIAVSAALDSAARPLSIRRM